MMICPARRRLEGCDENMILEVKVDAFSRHFRCFCFCCLILLIYHPSLAKLHVNLSHTEDFHCLLILNLLNEFISKFLLVYKVLFDLAALLIYFMAKHPRYKGLEYNRYQGKLLYPWKDMTGNIFIHVHNVISQPPNTNNLPKFNDVLPFYKLHKHIRNFELN